MPLTDNQIKGLKPAANPYKKTDRDNLRVLVSPAGGKSFQTRYQFDGKEKTITHGRYPAMRLAEARALNEQTHFLVAKGIDPMAKAAPRDERAARAKAASPKVRAVPATASGVDRERLLATVADEWWDRKKLPTLSPKNAGRVRTRVFDYFVAPLADKSVDDIEPREILAVIRQVESDHGIATAKRVYGFAKQIFAWAKVTRELAVNPALDLEDGLSATPKDKPLPYLKIEEVADFYAALRNNRGRNDVSSIALELYMHTVLRNSELRWARWENVRDDRLLIPEGGMKRVRDESSGSHRPSFCESRRQTGPRKRWDYPTVAA